MEAFQLRLWDGRIGRWLSPDPYGQYASPYLGMGNNPISLIDPDGGFAEGPGDPGKGFWGWLSGLFSSGPTVNGGDLDNVVIKREGKSAVDFMGGAGAGGMTLWGLNVRTEDIPDIYMEGHAAVTQGSYGADVKLLGTRVGVTGEFGKSSLYQIGFDLDTSRGRFDGGPLMNTSGISAKLGDTFGGGAAYGIGLDAQFDRKTGSLQSVKTSALIIEMTNEFNTSGANKGSISRTKTGFTAGAGISVFIGIEASFSAGLIYPGK